MKPQAYLHSAVHIVQQYRGEIPFATWLKAYFRLHKKYGSKDRKAIADLCFCYFRLGNAFAGYGLEDRFLIGQFLCHEKSLFVQSLKPEWSEYSALPLKEKMTFLDASQVRSIFPFADECSNEIERELFQLSFLQQPDLFLRIRPGKEQIVVKKLKEAGVDFSLTGACLRLSNSTKIDEVIRLNEEAVVQDISSQKVLEPLQNQISNPKSQILAWDCCAASGGKSILLHDTFDNVKLTVSDVRESILVNLKYRFRRASIQSYHSFVADVSASHFTTKQKFDLIICDAPCSGSGTWARTPESLHFFRREKIDRYSALQKRIALNASNSLKPGGYFLYITCSVFRKENEEVVSALQQKMQILSQRYFKAYDKRGDTLFAALFTV